MRRSLVLSLATVMLSVACGGAAPAASLTSPSTRPSPSPIPTVAVTPVACPAAPAAAAVPAEKVGEPLEKGSVQVGRGPGWIFPAGGAFWIFLENEPAFIRFDPGSKTTVAKLDLTAIPATSQNGQGIGGRTFGPDGLWFEWGTDLSAADQNQLVHVDTSTNKIAGDYKIPYVTSVIDTPHGLWALLNAQPGAAGAAGVDRLQRVDPQSGTLAGAPVPVGDGAYHDTPGQLATSGDDILVAAHEATGWLVDFDPVAGAVKRVTTIPQSWRGLAADSGSIYAGLLDRAGLQYLAQIDPATLCPSRVFGLGSEGQKAGNGSPIAPLISPGAVYVMYQDSALARLDVAKGSIVAVNFLKTLSISDDGFALDHGILWYSDFDHNQLLELNPAL